MKSKRKYKVIGLMSGTSLDGLDLACCVFSLRKNKWSFKITAAETIGYSREWRERLSEAHGLHNSDLLALDASFGRFIGEACVDFIRTNKLKKIDAIASHGHTVFHQPTRAFTYQLGNGNSIHAVTGLPVVHDFRSLDVVAGGQGAPLVPVGDRLLFSDYDVCLNLGGIANISFEKKKSRIAFDVCFVNMALNYLAGKKQLQFDDEGKLASRGSVNADLLATVEKIYEPLRGMRPSLAREDFETRLQPLLDATDISVEDRMRTMVESAANEIAAVIPGAKSKKKILITGGGAFNPALIATLSQKMRRATIAKASPQIIAFKEALVFAFLGVLRLRGEINVLKSVTGAERDSCSGSVVGVA